MIGTTMISKNLLDRFRAAFKRYGEQVLGDSDITVDFFASDLGMYLEVVLGSPKFQEAKWDENDDSVWEFLRADPEITKDDLALLLQIITEPEHVEFI